MEIKVLPILKDLLIRKIATMVKDKIEKKLLE